MSLSFIRNEESREVRLQFFREHAGRERQRTRTRFPQTELCSPHNHFKTIHAETRHAKAPAQRNLGNVGLSSSPRGTTTLDAGLLDRARAGLHGDRRATYSQHNGGALGHAAYRGRGDARNEVKRRVNLNLPDAQPKARARFLPCAWDVTITRLL